MKVMVTGATGLLGRSLRKELTSRDDLECVETGFRRANEQMLRLDLRDAKAARAAIASHSPDVVIHAAAERRPDVSENDPRGTRQINVEATRTVVDAASDCGAWVLYFSTDYVFDGSHPPYSPEAEVKPLNFYAQSKYEGEGIVRQRPENCILRVPVLYGEVESLEESAVTVIAAALAKGGNLEFDHWATRYPTLTDDVAVVCRQMIQRRAGDEKLRGTFHWSGEEALTKFEMAEIIADAWGLPRDNLIPDSRPPTGAPRPKNSKLDCYELEALGIGQRTPFRVAIPRCIEKFR